MRAARTVIRHGDEYPWLELEDAFDLKGATAGYRAYQHGELVARGPLKIRDNRIEPPGTAPADSEVLIYVTLASGDIFTVEGIAVAP